MYVYIVITEWRKHLRLKTNLMDNDYHDKVGIYVDTTENDVL